MRRDQLQDLRRDAGVGAGVALVVDDADAARVGVHLQPVMHGVAPGVVEADEADGLDAVRLHVLGHRLDHQGRGLRNGDFPCPALALDADVAGDDQRHLGLGGDAVERQRGRRCRRADQHVHLVVLDQLLAGLCGGGRIGAVVDLQQPDALPRHLARCRPGRRRTPSCRAGRSRRPGRSSTSPAPPSRRPGPALRRTSARPPALLRMSSSLTPSLECSLTGGRRAGPVGRGPLQRPTVLLFEAEG